MPSKKRRKTSNTQPQTKDAIKLQNQHHTNDNSNNDRCFEGDRLSHLLHSFKREVESELQSNKILPEKLWLKQHFAVGINEVTRLLERMAPCDDALAIARGEGSFCSVTNQGRGCPPGYPVTKLQAVLLASDCNSRWLIKHLPDLASSRNVPLIYIEDNKEGSLRLGEVVKVKTAIALGVKVKGSSINRLLEEVLHYDKSNGTECLDSTQLASMSCHGYANWRQFNSRVSHVPCRRP